MRFTGLIIPTLTPPHNPIGAFSVTVSYITSHHRVANMTKGTFPTNPAGDATINAKVVLPHPCKDPEVFVGLTRPTGAFVWFAMSNSEDEEED